MRFQIHDSDGSQLLSSKDDQSLLGALRKAGHDVPTSCRNGNCGLCHTKLLSGRVIQRQLNIEAPADIAPCIARAQSDLVLGPLPQSANSFQIVCQVLACDDSSLSLRLPAGRQPPINPGQKLYLQAPLEESVSVLKRDGRELLLSVRGADLHISAGVLITALYRRH